MTNKVGYAALCVATIAVWVLVFALSASYFNDDDAPKDRNGAVKPVTVYTEDGREVTCIIYTTVDRGGVDCDWGTPK